MWKRTGATHGKKSGKNIWQKNQPFFGQFIFRGLSFYGVDCIGTAIYKLLIGEAGEKKNLLKIAYWRANAPRFAFRRSEHAPASPISSGATQRQHSWRYGARTTSLIIPELAFKLGTLTGNRMFRITVEAAESR